jgi:hypothetical protein
MSQVTAKDGTIIAFEKTGTGPVVIPLSCTLSTHFVENGMNLHGRQNATKARAKVG